MKALLLLTSLALAVALALVTAIPQAFACGGMFCAAVPIDTPRAPEPVDQNAERVVFDVDEAENQTTMHVQISYVGSAEDFAWVLPAPTVPDVEESDVDFQTLDLETALQVVLPPTEPCPQLSGGGGDDGGGCGCAMSEDEASTAGGGFGDPSPDSEDPVTVYAHDFTDNYEFHVIGAEVTQDLIDWLQENGYNVSDNMTPVMEVYNEDGMVFLAVKLQEGRDASDVVPLAVTYEGTLPSIPIRLTAVAAQPLMGILVFVIADRPYAPANYARIVPDTDEIVFDERSRTNYFDWVARAADEEDGLLWVTELVGRYTGTERFEGAYLSRYYTRMSPHHMTLDPVFQPVDPATLSVANTLDLSDQQSLYSCQSVVPDRIPSACAFNYCGEGALCAVVDGNVGCDCPEGAVAQPLLGPSGQRSVTCVPEVNPYGVTDVAGGAGGPFDPCNAVDCGLGLCVLRGGFPTCHCDPGAFACLEQTGSVSCVAAPAGVQTFGPGAGSESRRNTVASAALPRETSPRGLVLAEGVWLTLLGACLGVGVLRRRSRERSAQG